MAYTGLVMRDRSASVAYFGRPEHPRLKQETTLNAISTPTPVPLSI